MTPRHARAELRGARVRASSTRATRSISIRGLAEAHATLSFLLTSALQFDEARRAAQQAVSLEPDNWRHQYRLGHALWGEARLRAFERALALYPQFAYARFEMAMVHVARGQFDAALDIVQRGRRRAGSAGAHGRSISGGRLPLAARRAARRARRLRRRHRRVRSRSRAGRTSAGCIAPSTRASRWSGAATRRSQLGQRGRRRGRVHDGADLHRRPPARAARPVARARARQGRRGRRTLATTGARVRRRPATAGSHGRVAVRHGVPGRRRGRRRRAPSRRSAELLDSLPASLRRLDASRSSRRSSPCTASRASRDLLDRLADRAK